MAKRRETPDDGELREEVTRLADEVRILRLAIDEFRVDFIHMLRCLPEKLPPPYAHLQTLAEAITPEVEPDRSSTNASSVPPKQESPSASKPLAKRRDTLFD